MIILRKKTFSRDFNVYGEFRMSGIPLQGRPLRFIGDDDQEDDSEEEPREEESDDSYEDEEDDE